MLLRVMRLPPFGPRGYRTPQSSVHRERELYLEPYSRAALPGDKCDTPCSLFPLAASTLTWQYQYIGATFCGIQPPPRGIACSARGCCERNGAHQKRNAVRQPSNRVLPPSCTHQTVAMHLSRRVVLSCATRAGFFARSVAICTYSSSLFAIRSLSPTWKAIQMKALNQTRKAREVRRGEREGQKRQTDKRQTDRHRQTGRQGGRQADRQTDR